ncbi:hypothetical protein PHJA_002919400 [Phtheirospermum japonicum]|uniref:DNA-directed RNA polymerase III subunit n=1 Tax=Phtheirospermum japonicum TaxID=374723 RepID=A0A830DJH2_9LAMI|nr:hypothetical protein PHJA_001010400 [Phtheirospermum japonicum]GFQ07754.1 hypothetical protein PHJA_002919400 [Phtheirospermum japonicum]
MAFRGRGRGRGGRGFGGGGYAKQEPFELFPVIGEIGKAEYSDAKLQLIRWSGELQRHWKSSPYFYEDRRLRPEKAQAEKPDIERYSDRNLPKTNVKLELRDWIMLDQNHVPAELAEGGKRKRRPKRIKWNPDLGKDIFDKLEKMSEGKDEETEKKEDDEEEEEDENEEENGEISDEGDYEQNEDFDDDEDDFNMADDGNDEPFY